MTLRTSLPVEPLVGDRTGDSASDRLRLAIESDKGGQIEEAIAGYESVVADARAEGENSTLADALRRLAVAHHRRSNGAHARSLVRESHQVARSSGEELLAAQALNSLAAFDLADGAFDSARENLLEVARSPTVDAALLGRVRQNLGIIANIQGQLDEAEEHYEKALEAFQESGDERGSAMAFNSLGILSADREQWDEADTRFRKSVELTSRVGDVHLRGLALLSHTEVHIARGHYSEALKIADEALRIFDALGVARHKADAYRVLGVVYRATKRMGLAEARLRTALELAQSAEAVLEQAESSRELALLYRELGRNQDALRQLTTSRQLFRRLDARRDLVDVSSRLDDLQNTFLAVVRDWGQSIESADSYTHGHCERVATYAVGVAGALGMDEEEQTTIRIGAYLHDLGKIKTPHEVLNKPGRLTTEEFDVMKRHPVEGLELLVDIEFPWDIKPMIRWHHEKYCGGGYPDGLQGEKIPRSAQIICIADVYDALTTTRSYRGAMSNEKAIEVMHESRGWWRKDVFEAFLRYHAHAGPSAATSASEKSAASDGLPL
ncbi:MAG: HD domain-containing phosphohydrolase [Gemmatimonadaceae bacterium]